jgi:pyruvate/2-oxoacid:ferredoxin oxidoreductase beta subunit
VRYRITHEPAGIPVAEYLRPQTRFAHLTEAEVATIQSEVDQRWEALVARAGSGAPRGLRVGEESPA